MLLIELMDRVPLWLVGLIVMIVAQTYAIGLMLLTRSIFGVSRLAENNEVAGFNSRSSACSMRCCSPSWWWPCGKSTATLRRRFAMRPRRPSISTTSASDCPWGMGPLFASASSPTQTSPEI